MKELTIFDLHCDSLLYLSKNEKRTIFDSKSRCSYNQLKNGKVSVQTFAFFDEFPNETIFKKQLGLFKKLPSKHSDFYHLNKELQKDKIGCLMAIENLSLAISSQTELVKGLEFIKQIHAENPIFYVSLTWNEENRFGGGANTTIGLKEDGKKALDLFAEIGIAIDLSHASDNLAFQIISYKYKSCPTLKILASHSNTRSICSVVRNLPDEIIKEIANCKGIIGLTAIKSFIGQNFDDLTKHLRHLINIVGIDYCAIGSDFYYNKDLSKKYRKPFSDQFHKEFTNSSHFPSVLQKWQTEIQLSDSDLYKISFQNAYRFKQLLQEI
ncbi:MAG: hypothetical protein BGO10_10360 [Chlamydia sp. 32-24]|nr:MAG: hypothetical protein BGO10_10360 [Chlamydia sp. 32-24]